MGPFTTKMKSIWNMMPCGDSLWPNAQRQRKPLKPFQVHHSWSQGVAEAINTLRRHRANHPAAAPQHEGRGWKQPLPCAFPVQLDDIKDNEPDGLHEVQHLQPQLISLPRHGDRQGIPFVKASCMLAPSRSSARPCCTRRSRSPRVRPGHAETHRIYFSPPPVACSIESVSAAFLQRVWVG